MKNLSDFRAQYPQYDDMNDQQLADALHRKFYSDIPKDQYLQRLGLASSDPAIPTRAQVSAEAKANQGGGALRTGANVMQQALDSATFGGWDEAVSAFWNPLSAGRAAFGQEPPDGEYYKQLGQLRAQRKAFEETNPIAAGTAQIGGAFFSPAPGIGLVAKAPGVMSKIAGGAALGYGSGYATGIGQGEGNLENRLEKGRIDAQYGAAASGLLPGVVAGASKIVQGGKNLLAPFTAAGRERIAREQLAEGVTGVKRSDEAFPAAAQRAVENIDAAQAQAAQINEPLGLLEGYLENFMGRGLIRAGDQWIDPATKQVAVKPYQPTTGVAIGTPAALGTEQRARLQAPDQFIERDARNNEALTDYFRTLDSGDPAVARQALADVGDQAALRAAQAAEATQQAQAQAVSDIRSSTGRSPEDINTANYDVMRGRFQAARQKKNELYGAVPNEVIPGSASLRETAAGLQNAFEAAPSPVNAVAKVDADMTSQELMQVRREAIKEMRAAQRAGDMVSARKSGQIASAASATLKGETSPEAVRAALKPADEFYTQQYLPNYGTYAGSKLATPGPGGLEAKLAPSQGLSAWVKPDGQGKTVAPEYADQLKRIAGDNPAVQQNVRDYFFNLAADKAVKGDAVDPAAIRKVMKDHTAFLERFPEVRNDLVRAANKADNAANQATVSKELAAGAAAYTKSLPGQIAASDPGRMAEMLKNAKDPATAAREVRSHLLAAGPEAQAGLKQAVTDKIYAEITQDSRFTSATGQEIGSRKLSAGNVEKLLADASKWKPLLSEIYNPQEMRVLSNLKTELSHIQKLGNRATSGSSTAENAGRMLSADNILRYVAQASGIGGVGYGAYSQSPGTATAAGLIALTAWKTRAGQQAIQQLVNKAMLDPELAKTMLQKVTPENAAKAVKLFDSVIAKSPNLGTAAAAVTD